jgi:hypothetical protein
MQRFPTQSPTRENNPAQPLCRQNPSKTESHKQWTVI